MFSNFDKSLLAARTCVKKGTRGSIPLNKEGVSLFSISNNKHIYQSPLILAYGKSYRLYSDKEREGSFPSDLDRTVICKNIS